MAYEEQRQITIYVAKDRRDEKPIERLQRLAKKRKRSMNFVALEAILRYLEEEENSK